MRTTEKWEDLWIGIEAFCNSLDIPVCEDELTHVSEQ